MHLRSVEIFCEVVQQRSFSKAAEVFRVSQSSVSQAVQSLEERLGAQLIARSKRPFELTPAGNLYFSGCRKLLESFHAMEDQVHRLQDKVVGPVRVAAIYSVGLYQMDCYVRRFEELYPEAALRIDFGHPDEIYEAVINDEVDLGLVSFPQTNSELASIPWQEQELVLVTAPDHRLATRSEMAIEELSGEAYVAFTPELTIRKMIDRWLKELKISVNVVHAFDNMETTKRDFEIRAGVSLLPISSVRREVDIGSLAAIRLSNVTWVRPLGIVHKRHKVLSNAVAKFIELLHEDPESFAGNETGKSKTVEEVGITS